MPGPFQLGVPTMLFSLGTPRRYHTQNSVSCRLFGESAGFVAPTPIYLAGDRSDPIFLSPRQSRQAGSTVCTSTEPPSQIVHRLHSTNQVVSSPSRHSHAPWGIDGLLSARYTGVSRPRF